MLEQIHYGQSNPAGHLACTLRGPQAFRAKWGEASSFNAQSHRNQWGISLTHYMTVMACGLNRKTQNGVGQIIFFTLKQKWAVVVVNLLVCWADNAWPPARTLAYNHTIFFQCGCKDLGSASISSSRPVLKNNIGSSFLKLWPQCNQWHLVSEDVPVNAEGCVSFICNGYLESHKMCAVAELLV